MLDHLDTLISFVVIISGLSVVVTTLTQMASAALGLRGSNLRWGLTTLIEQLDPGLEAHAATLSERVLQHPLISDSTFSGFRTRLITRWKLASTIRKEELLEILHRLSSGDGGGTAAGSEPWRVALQGALDRFDRAAIDQVIAGVREARVLPPIGGTGTSVEDMVKAAALLPRNIDEWFGPVMDRVSQRFALHTRVWTVVFSFVLAFALHLDTFRIMALLSSDAELRARVASGAEALRSQAELPIGAAVAGETDPARRELIGSAARLQSLLDQQLSFRLIPDPYPSPFYEYWKPGWSHLWGILVSGILISLGAPFWFNALKTLCNLRPTVASRVDSENDGRQPA
jgi:hypothetical protein